MTPPERTDRRRAVPHGSPREGADAAFPAGTLWLGAALLAVAGTGLALIGAFGVILVIGIPVGVPALLLAAVHLPVAWGAAVRPDRRWAGWVAGLCTGWVGVIG